MSSPLPWRIDSEYPRTIRAADGSVVTTVGNLACSPLYSDSETKPHLAIAELNAQLIVAAVNATRPTQETPAAPRGKPCTCSDVTESACGLEQGFGKLGELWYCRRLFGESR